MNVPLIVERIRAEGHKLTPQRLAIIEALAASRIHPTANEIYAQVSQQYPMLGLATVYKTLDLLKALGEVVETGFGPGGARYEPNLHPHINLVCRTCGRVVDVDIELRDWRLNTSDLAARVGFTIEGGHIEYFGICADCGRGGQA